jgi:hypothetical protein
LKAQKFSLQANSKTKEGGDRPERDAQFGHINQIAGCEFQAPQKCLRLIKVYAINFIP